MPIAKASHLPVPAGDSPGGSGKIKRKSEKTDEVSGQTPDTARETRALPEPETIHSRSVQMGSERLGVVAKMDLVDVRAALATETAPATEGDRADSIEQGED
ncbi:MAG: hypothetical protein KGS61_12020 [Verrucomicrobia bacterium]|nr:hypothetical protein [Verrucomicrobiota bacterium]